MSTENGDFETHLRRMFQDTAAKIESASAGLHGDGHAARRRSRTRVFSIATALVVLAAAITAAVSLGLRSSNPPSTTGIVVVRSTGSVQVLDPDTGAVERQLVGPSPVDSHGHTLSDPGAIAVGGGHVFVSYSMGERPIQPVIVSMPLAGGTLTPVAYGDYPAVSADGSRLAFVTFSGAGERIVVKKLPVGSEHTVWSSSTPASGLGATLASVDGLAWWRDNELAVTQTDVQLPDKINPGHPTIPGILSKVLLFDLTSPPSSSNPRTIGPNATADPSASWTDPQFVGTDTLAVLTSDSATRCTGGPASLRIDTANGTSATGANLPPRTDHVLYDGAGRVIAYVEDPDLCPPPGARQTPSTSTTTRPSGAVLSGSAVSSSVTFRLRRADLEVYADHDGNHRKLADHVGGAVALP